MMNVRLNYERVISSYRVAYRLTPHPSLLTMRKDA